MTGKARDIRSERITHPQTHVCLYCGEKLPQAHRANRLYCDAKCRKGQMETFKRLGEVRSVRRLASGKMSIVIHMDGDVNLTPRDPVFIGSPKEEI